jgi:hypothetical protein
MISVFISRKPLTLQSALFLRETSLFAVSVLLYSAFPLRLWFRRYARYRRYTCSFSYMCYALQGYRPGLACASGPASL